MIHPFQIPGTTEATDTATALIETATQMKLIQTAVALVLAWVVSRLLIRWVPRGFEDRRLRYQTRKAILYGVWMLGLLVIGTIWLEGIRQLGTFLGLLSAGLAIALRDLVTDVAGWLFIMWREPFKLGDRVQIGAHAGDVVDISIMQFALLEIGNWVDADQSTGRVIHVPNSHVLQHPVANYISEFPFLWHEIPVLVTFESDWRLAKSFLTEIVDEESRVIGDIAREAQRRSPGRTIISYSQFTGTVYTTARADGVLLTMRLLVEPRGRRITEQRIWERILTMFEEHDSLEFAYHTTRIFRRDEEEEHVVEARRRGQLDSGLPGV